MLAVILMLLACCGTFGLENGQAQTPQMGWNSWNSFGPKIDEDMIRATADLMVDLGLRDAGYVYLNLDDGWSELERDDGRLTANKAAFPWGIPALADYVHGKGLKFGIYGDAGSHTCAGFPGSRGFEEVDARTFADWGVDYLKYDNCFAPASDWVVDRYTAMRDALNATGRPILYSLCEWGVADPWLWAPAVGNSWRTTEDIQPNWESIIKILDSNHGLSRFAGQGGWNDADMLEVGNGQLTVGEQRTHFALWALLKSPLLIGADIRSIHPSSLEVLKAAEVIAIHQDELGVAGDLIWQQGANRVYAAPLAGGDRAVVLMNTHTTGGQYLTSNLTVTWRQLGLPHDASARVRDLFAEADLGEATGSVTAAVQAHDVRVLRISPLGGQRSDDWRPWHQQQAAPRQSSAGSGRKIVPGGDQHAMYAP